MTDYLNSAKGVVQQNIPDTTALSQGITNMANTIKQTASNATADFSSPGAVNNAGNEFLNSNSIVARFVFLILALIVFMFLLKLGFRLVSYFTMPSRSPYLIWGMKSGSDYTVIPQDPASGNAIVYRSNNRNGGAEFTWSMWLKIDSIPTATPLNKCIFVKGSDNFSNTTGIATPNQAPGLYISNHSTDGVAGNQLQLTYQMDVVSPINGAVSVSNSEFIANLPIGKWFHVAIRLQNKTLDCYINGVITKRIDFGDYIPKQNYDNVIYAGNGGFPGSISNLRYHDYAMSVFEITSEVYYGPNLKSADGGKSGNYTDYLGMSWYKSVS